MKQNDIEQLLNTPCESRIKLMNLDAFTIRELARYYGTELIESIFYLQTEIKRNNVTVMLISKPKQL